MSGQPGRWEDRLANYEKALGWLDQALALRRERGLSELDEARRDAGVVEIAERFAAMLHAFADRMRGRRDA